jgi:hypothetical protein
LTPLVNARLADRNAEIGAKNPYCGQGMLMWRLGYQTRLAEMLMTSPARQKYLRNRGAGLR